MSPIIEASIFNFSISHDMDETYHFVPVLSAGLRCFNLNHTDLKAKSIHTLWTTFEYPYFCIIIINTGAAESDWV